MSKLTGFVSIGAGNVATHLVNKLCAAGYKLLQVYSRTDESAKLLAGLHNSSFTTDSDKVISDADFYLVSIPDQALKEFLKAFKIHNKIIFHTAGSHGTEVFGEEYMFPGVLYPLQTFTKDLGLNIEDVPVFIEARSSETLDKIESIAQSISPKVFHSDAETRKKIHLAAVFACNFTNHMFVVAAELMKSEGLDPSVLKPLIEETYRKSVMMNPEEAQTGPAVRNDRITMDKHINMLENQPLWQKIYIFTSQSIFFTKNSKHNNPPK